MSTPPIFTFDEKERVLWCDLTMDQFYALNETPVGEAGREIGVEIVKEVTRLIKQHGPITVNARMLMMGALAAEHAKSDDA